MIVNNDVLPVMVKVGDKRGVLIQTAANMFPTFDRIAFQDVEGKNIFNGMLYTYAGVPKAKDRTLEMGNSVFLIMRPKEVYLAFDQEKDTIKRVECVNQLLFSLMHSGALISGNVNSSSLNGNFRQYLKGINGVGG